MNVSTIATLFLVLATLAFTWIANRCLDEYKRLVELLEEMLSDMSSRLVELEPDGERREAALNLFRVIQKARLGRRQQDESIPTWPFKRF